MKNQKLIPKVLLGLVIFGANIYSSFAQDIEQIRWKSEDQVRAILGEPDSVSAAVGTHASYTMWKYKSFTVAFANGKAFHLFDKNSLRRLELTEQRPEKN